MRRSACGLWATGRSLVAVTGDRQRAVVAPATDDARLGLVELLRDAGTTELVLPEALARGDPVGQLALRAGLVVWVVPAAVLDPLRRAAGLTPGPPRATAVMLARLPGIPALRAQLRRLGPARDERQLSLL